MNGYVRLGGRVKLISLLPFDFCVGVRSKLLLTRDAPLLSSYRGNGRERLQHLKAILQSGSVSVQVLWLFFRIFCLVLSSSEALHCTVLLSSSETQLKSISSDALRERIRIRIQKRNQKLSWQLLISKL